MSNYFSRADLCDSSCRPNREERDGGGGGGGGGNTSQGWGVGVTSDPEDRLMLSFQQHPLSLLFTSPKKKPKGGVKKSRNNEERPGGDEMQKRTTEEAKNDE